MRREALIEYPFADAPPAGATVKVAAGIHWLSTPLPFRLRAINLYLLEDGPGWTIVDCGYGRKEVREQWEQVWRTTIAGRPIARLIVTHFHPDHAGNAAWLCQRWGLLPWMTQAEWLTANLAQRAADSHDLDKRLEFYREHGLDGEMAAVFRNGHVPYAQGVELPAAYRRLVADQVLHIGGRRYQVLVGQGHSPEHASLYCADDGILIAGDQLLPEITTNVSVWPGEPEADPLRLYLDSLDRFDRILRPDTLVLPSHRRPFHGAHVRTAQLRAHHQERLHLLRTVVAQGPVSAAQLLPHLFRRDLDGHQIGFAMGEALAHLNFLVNAGELQRQRDAAGTRFAATRARN